MAAQGGPKGPMEPGTTRLAASGLTDRIRKARRWLSQEAEADLSTAAGRSRALWQFELADHAFLRRLWTNTSEIAPGVFRSNQPDPARIAALAAQGFATIVNLRGTRSTSFYLLEREACAAQGLTLIDHRLNSAVLPPRDELLELCNTFVSAAKPMLIHCKSGADRTGLAAAIYLILICDAPVDVALRQLHWRYLHFSKGPRGVLDHMIHSYAKAQAASGIGLRDWIATAYDPAALTAEFRAGRG